jgi:PAS domain S-box-containing protein
MFGYTAEDMVGESSESLVPQDQHHEISAIRDVIENGRRVERIETQRLRRGGTPVDVSITVSPIKNSDGQIQGASIVLRDITERKRQEKERLRLIEELKEALRHVKTLNGLLPICASCKKIRNDGGYWEQVETYIRSRSNAEFTHGICPDCVRLLYPEYQSILQRSEPSQASAE